MSRAGGSARPDRAERLLGSGVPSSRSTPGSHGRSPAPEGEAWSVLAHLLTGIGVYGGIGYLLDRWWSTGFLTPVGLLLGAAAGLYLVWVRYGRVPPDEDPAPAGAGDAGDGTRAPHDHTTRREHG